MGVPDWPLFFSRAGLHWTRAFGKFSMLLACTGQRLGNMVGFHPTFAEALMTRASPSLFIPLCQRHQSNGDTQ
jgi:hypothetical protein